MYHFMTDNSLTTDLDFLDGFEGVKPYCRSNMTDGWMEDLRFYVLFNSISLISGQWVFDNERLCAMELCLQLRRFCLKWGSSSVC